MTGGFQAFLAHFKYKERQGEEPHYRKWFQSHGFNLFEGGAIFEGGGDGKELKHRLKNDVRVFAPK